jgi:hypothetical protein
MARIATIFSRTAAVLGAIVFAVSSNYETLNITWHNITWH